MSGRRSPLVDPRTILRLRVSGGWDVEDLVLDVKLVYGSTEFTSCLKPLRDDMNKP